MNLLTIDSCILPTYTSCFSFFFYSYADHRDLHSFPTRRSSDLDIAPVSDAVLETFKGAIVLCPPSALSDRWTRRFKDRKSTRLNSSHVEISYAVFCLKTKKKN